MFSTDRAHYNLSPSYNVSRMFLQTKIRVRAFTKISNCIAMYCNVIGEESSHESCEYIQCSQSIRGILQVRWRSEPSSRLFGYFSSYYYTGANSHCLWVYGKISSHKSGLYLLFAVFAILILNCYGCEQGALY